MNAVRPASSFLPPAESAAPLSEDQLRHHLLTLGLPPAGIEYVVAAAKSRPARLVGSGPKKNMPGEMSSPKPASLDEATTHWRVQFESRSVELPFAVVASADPNVLLLLDQPTPVPLTILDKNGRTKRKKYTADYLTVTKTDVRVTEMKAFGEIAALCGSQPLNWHREGDSFRYLPAEQLYQELGIAFQVVAAESISPLLVQNILFLRSQSSISDPESEAVQRRIASYVSANGPCSIADLVNALKLAVATPVLQAIGMPGVHVDLELASLLDPYSRIICATNGEAQCVGRALASIQKGASTGESVSLEELCDPRHLARFGYRIGVVTEQDVPWEGMKGASLRTKRRWKTEYNKRGLDGIRPKFHKCGPQEALVGKWHDDLLQKHIRKYKGSIKRWSRRQAHTRYMKLLARIVRAGGVVAAPVLYSTYCLRWGARKHSIEDGYSQGGARQANAAAPHGDVDAQIPLATHPFHVAHVDHCLAPSSAEWELTGQQGQPWLTALVDAKTGETLGRVLRFEYPSFDTDALVLRDCVRRHGRLPKFIVSDGGPDFRSAMFQATLAELAVSWIKRPDANPRSGQPVERSFLTFAQAACRGKTGFVPDLVNLRSISRSKSPGLAPKRIFESLVRDTDRLLFEVMPRLRSTDGSPSAWEERSEFEEIYGPQGIATKFDLRFLVATSRPLDSSGSTEPSGAIRLDGTRYYSTKLHGCSVSFRSISLRRDPEDSTVLYFCLDKAWNVAKSRDALHNRGRSDEQVVLDTLGKKRMTKEEMDARNQALHGSSRGSTKNTDMPTVRDRRAQKSSDAPTKRQSATWASVESLPTVEASRVGWRRDSQSNS